MLSPEISNPQFKRYFKVETLAPDTVYLLAERAEHSEQTRTVLTGRVYFLLAPLLDGQRSVDQMMDALSGQASPAQIQYALARLRRAGYLIESDGLPTDQGAFWDLHGAQGVVLRDRRVRIHTTQSLNYPDVAQVLSGLLTPLGVECLAPDSASPADMTVWIVDDYLDPALEMFNRQAVQTESSWLIIKPIGSILWIGPLFEPAIHSPDGSACWSCLAQRLAINRNVEEFIRVQKELATPLVLSRAALPSTIHTGLALAATEIARKLATPAESHLRNRLFTLDTLSLQTEWHTLVKRPQCAVCGDPTPHAAAPPRLHSQPKRSTADNGHRSESAAATYERYKYHVSPITGAVSLLEAREDIPGIYTYLSGDNRARAREWQQVRRGLRRSTSGKGVHAIQAKVSALCEALERYSGVFQGDKPRSRATYTELGESAIHPNDCLNFSDAQLRDREALNRAYPPLCHVVAPFNPLTPIDWTPVWSLTDQAFKYLPTAYCYYDTTPPPGDTWTCYADSNGCAAGSSLEDAIFQGFMELVERDSISIWWFNRIQRPALDLDTMNDPFIAALRDQYAAMGREFWVIDVTTDLNIPAFVALSRRNRQTRRGYNYGCGRAF